MIFPFYTHIPVNIHLRILYMMYLVVIARWLVKLVSNLCVCVYTCVRFSHQTEEKSVQDSEQLLADLRRRSTSIAPLKYRRAPPNRSVTLESLCDWESTRVEHFWVTPKCYQAEKARKCHTSGRISSVTFFTNLEGKAVITIHFLGVNT